MTNRDPNAETRAELRRLLSEMNGVWTEPQAVQIAGLMMKHGNALLDEIDAARRFIGKLEEHTIGPLCWKCEVLEARGYCACEIAANE